MNLSKGQSEVLQFVGQGHNLLLTGQAGTGKFLVIRSIIKECHRKNLSVAVFCSSGIACKVYPRGVASTVHSFYGLGSADLPNKQLIERAVDNSITAKRIRNVDVIVWDEASMSSSRIFEIDNSLHNELTLVPEFKQFPFAGKQLVLVGEFLLLRPVPNRFDRGNFLFYSDVFNFAISHRYELTEILRHSCGEEGFVSALKKLGLGYCSSES